MGRKPGRPRASLAVNLAVNLALSAAVVAAGIAGLEVASRWLLPVSPGTQMLDQNGGQVDIFAGDDIFRPDIRFRQVSAEFDAVTNIGPLGYRAPSAASSPTVIVLGDSFAFGQGLADDDTFAAIFCAEAAIPCVNLGFPGTGTLRQMRILRRAFDRHPDWRPAEVKLFVLAMSSSFMAGNDFWDVLAEAPLTSAGVSPPAADDASPAADDAPSKAERNSPVAWAVARRQWLLAHSNLLRLVYAQFGSSIRSWFSPSVPAAQLEGGIAAMAGAFAGLRALSAERGFTLTVYVLHPVQDLLRGTWPETAAAVQTAAGVLPVVDTAAALLDDPAAYYFAYDGHLNPAGARRIAAFLLDEWRARNPLIGP